MKLTLRSVFIPDLVVDRVGRGAAFSLAWRKNQLMKRWVRRERDYLSTGAQEGSNFAASDNAPIPPAP